MIKELKQFNKWRRGDETLPQPNATEIGLLIDKVVVILETIKEMQKEAKDRAKQFKKTNDLGYWRGKESEAKFWYEKLKDLEIK